MIEFTTAIERGESREERELRTAMKVLERIVPRTNSRYNPNITHAGFDPNYNGAINVKSV